MKNNPYSILALLFVTAWMGGCGSNSPEAASTEQTTTSTPPAASPPALNVRKPVIPGRDDMYQIDVPLSVITPGKAPETGAPMHLVVVAQGEKPFAWFKDNNMELYLPPRQFAEAADLRVFRIAGNDENVVILQYGQMFYSVSSAYSELKALARPDGLE